MGGVSKKKKQNETDMRVTCYHVNDEVTGSSFLVEVDGLHILLDMGLYQNQSRRLETIYKINRQKFDLPFYDLDYIVVTSSHADHCSALGIVGRNDVDFKGKCICTELSQELIALNLYDSAFLMKNECEAYSKKNNKNIEPLYTKIDVDNVMNNLRGYGYNEKIYLNNKTYIELIPNGHLSGDCSILLTYEKDEYTKKTLLYLGDHNYGKKKSKPFTKVWEKRTLKPDCVITESTYGGETQVDEDNISKLEEYIISEVIQNRKTLFIPAFAIHRSTELAYMLKVIWNRNKFIRNANIPIYMCGNMMSKAHKIIGNPKYKDFYDEQWQEQDELFGWDGIRILDNFKDVQSKAVNQTPKILIASSGMLTGGYSKFLLSCYVSQKNCSILFTGYQGIDTDGRKILEHENKTITIDGKKYIIRATILDRLHLSGHADNKGLVKIFDTINQHNLKKVLIVHGEDYRKECLQEQLQDKLGDKVEVLVPKSRQVIKI